jgi:hypothetical protein
MSKEAALAAEQVSEDDYEAFYAVLSETARGRAFLEEHARRQRHAETEMLLAALKRLENQVAQTPPADAEVAVVVKVRGARAEIDAVKLTAAVTELVSTLDPVQPQFSASRPAQPPLARPVAPPTVQPPFALAISAVAAQALAEAEPEAEPIKVLKAGSIPPPPPFAGEDFSSGISGGELDEAEPAAMAASPFVRNDPPGIESAGATMSHDLDEPQAAVAIRAPVSEDDPLAPIMSLSEEERLALFT